MFRSKLDPVRLRRFYGCRLPVNYSMHRIFTSVLCAFSAAVAKPMDPNMQMMSGEYILILPVMVANIACQTDNCQVLNRWGD